MSWKTLFDKSFGTERCGGFFSLEILFIGKKSEQQEGRGMIYPGCFIYCSIRDYMFEESVCLLLRATWFMPLEVHYEDTHDPLENYCPYEDEVDDEDDDLEEAYFNSPNVRIENRRWGDNGYVRAGRQEARPVYRANPQDEGASSSSRQPKKKEVAVKETVGTGRRAKRALKREAADKAAAAKHQQHLARLGRN